MIERAIPHIACASLVSVRGSTEMAPFSNFTATSSGTVNESSPFVPFTETRWPSTLAVTPEGMATGFFPIRDMFAFLSPSEDLAEHFAADIGFARSMVRHHAFRRGDDRDAETVADARHSIDRGIDATARLRHALDFADYRLPFVIFELDVELGAAIAEIGRRIAADIALVLQHIEHVRTNARARRRHLALLAHLGIADAGEHVAQGIVNCHRSLLTSST